MMTNEEHMMVFELRQVLGLTATPRRWQKKKHLEDRETDFILHLVAIKHYEPSRELTEKQRRWLRTLHLKYTGKLYGEATDHVLVSLEKPSRKIDLEV